MENRKTHGISLTFRREFRARSLFGTSAAVITLSPNTAVLESQEQFSDILGTTWKFSLKLDTEAGLLSAHIQCLNINFWKLLMLHQPVPKSCECTFR